MKSIQLKEDNAWLYDSNELSVANLVWRMSRLQKAGVEHNNNRFYLPPLAKNYSGITV